MKGVVGGFRFCGIFIFLIITSLCVQAHDVKKKLHKKTEMSRSMTNDDKKIYQSLFESIPTHVGDLHDLGRGNLKQKKFFFIQTMKCGSTTFGNICHRYADVNHLAHLSPKDFGRFNVRDSIVEGSYWQDYDSFDVCCHHSRFDEYGHFGELFKWEDTAFVTILREPFEWLKSSIAFHRIYNRFKMSTDSPDWDGDVVKTFLNNPKMYAKSTATTTNTVTWPSLLRPVYFFLGNRTDFINLSDVDIRDAMHVITKKIDIVLLMEHYYESLVYLRRKMGWTNMASVIFHAFKLGQSKKRAGGSTLPLNTSLKYNDLTSLQTENMHDYFSVEYQMYEYANNTLWKAVKKGGADFAQEVVKLKYINEEFSKWCRKECEWLRENRSELSVYRERCAHIDSNRSVKTKWRENFDNWDNLTSNKILQMRSLCSKIFTEGMEYAEFLHDRARKEHL
jgi:hypothetical protein